MEEITVLKYCRITDIGGRKHNEDAVSTITFEHPHGCFHLLIVADGLGGHAAGEVASKLAVIELTETVKRTIPQPETMTMEAMKTLLKEGFKKANDEICYQAKLTPERSNMGTTLVAALLRDDGTGVVANVGDSRAYLVGDKISRVTVDHSYVQELVDREIITEDEAFDHPDKNIVTKMMGLKDVEPDLYEVKLDENVLLLSSDGLSDTLRDVEIQAAVSGRLDEMCRRLVKAALARGAKDNVTVVLASR
ncbi:MAG: serine/threonine-protein phosphatase [Methanosarcinales archaeon]|uniref:Serine/threonine-protein phosphatase n=1 Tax=Candidatus Ethanoperedens thermophilum TaxID=2766897 RepID=A0A848D9K8_9EURY|nr:serine/threonine-protein phosphatase [Candidatus Ethanoperedens thermophilum]